MIRQTIDKASLVLVWMAKETEANEKCSEPERKVEEEKAYGESIKKIIWGRIT